MYKNVLEDSELNKQKKKKTITEPTFILAIFLTLAIIVCIMLFLQNRALNTLLWVSNDKIKKIESSVDSYRNNNSNSTLLNKYEEYKKQQNK